MDLENDFDVGPLTWVKPEIDVALDAATGILAAWNEADLTPLKECATYLHQVSGALQIVDLQGVYLVGHAAEGLLADMQARPELRNRESADLVARTFAALKSYLEGLMAGGANAELALMPVYAELQTRRGAEPPPPSELFFPDTDQRARRPAPEPGLDEAALGRALRHARAQYQRGLLQYLKGKGAMDGLALMGEAVDEIARLAPGAAQYTFWWAAGAMFDVFRKGGPRTDDPWSRQMFGRLDMQMRRLIDGSRQLAERLFRDVLYCLIRESEPAGRVAEAWELFGLHSLVPASGRGGAEMDADLESGLDRMREAVNAAKEQWLRLCGGRREGLEPFREAVGQLLAGAERTGDGALKALAGAVHEVTAAAVDAATAVQNEALQVEMATALLLLQHGAENHKHLGVDFGDHAGLQAGRLRAAVSDEAALSAYPGVPLLDEIARQAQERLLLAQVAREIQTNLRQIEEILDRFFRNAQERSGLPLVPGLLKQVQGALSMLQLDTAVDLVRRATERIETLSSGGHEVAADELDWIAEAISTLGLYVDALRNGRDDTAGLQRLLNPPGQAGPKEVSVESDLAESTKRLREAASHLAGEEGYAEGTREEIAGELSRIARDAELVGDAGLRGRADEAARLLEEGDATPAEMRAALEAIAAPETATPVSEAPVPAAGGEGGVDAELLEVYLEEAKEVLADIDGRLGRLRETPHDLAGLTEIRRGFHTLKGSGRMVGLDALAEVAWEAEQTLNLWLGEERAVHGEVLDFIDLTAWAYRHWVAELENRGAVDLDAGEIVARARRLRGEEAAKPSAGTVPALEATVPEVPAGEAPTTEAETQEPVPEALPEPEPEMVMVGRHPVPAPLFAIFTEEAARRLADMREGLASLAETADPGRWEDFARAAHTLAGIARTTGLSPLAEAAHAVENWAMAWPDKVRSLPPDARAEADAVLDLLAEALEAIAGGVWPSLPDDLPGRLPEAEAEIPSEVEIPVETETTPEPGQEEACDPELLPIFLAEADELLPRIGDSLRRWRADPADPEPCRMLQRALHTLKGSARMAGALRLGDRAHDLESRLAELAGTAPGPEILDGLEHEYDALAEQVDGLRGGSGAPVPARLPELPVALPVAPGTEDDAGMRAAFRARAGLLDNLINEAGEVSIARARVEANLNAYKQTAEELTANVERLRGQLRELEIEAEAQIGARLSRAGEDHFDPLEFDRYTRLQELTRLMAESVNDVSTAQENLLSGLSEVEYTLLQQSRTTRALQHGLMRIRMVRLNSQAERLHRIVRQSAKELGRKARLHIEGGDTELDRTVLDKAMVPFEHLLRNAVAHGIESADRRHAAGKPEYGEIRLDARQEGTDVVLTLSDDGAGIDLDRVRARAEALGWVGPGDTVERERLESFLFMPGFTTSETVTQVAGRGVGLDVVRSEIASVGGRIRVDSEPGRGTRFSIRLPATLALAQVVLAAAGDQVYAIPAGMVVLVRETRDEEWHAAVAAGRMDLDGLDYPLRSLAELTGQPPQPVEGRYRTVLLLRSGDERVAMRVDQLRGNAEAVVKAIGPQLSRVPGIAGATVLADGRVALILNPFALMESAPAGAAPVVEAAPDEERAPLVLVVDDSLTVRKFTTRLLEREGYRVATAKDGVEALEFMQEEVPAVMLLDIEMPRMDGFEVARHVRADARTRGLPIIMITSRTADKHRDHAAELGVDRYMGKPYQEEELLAAIAGYLTPSS